MSNFLDQINKATNAANKFVNEANLKSMEGVTSDFDPSRDTTGQDVSHIRNNLEAFANIYFTFPVTDRNERLVLPAFLTSFSDSFSPNWNSTPVYGRADPIPIYRNTTRSISIGFKIPNQDLNDANSNFLALGTLIKNLYPVYKSFGSSDFFGFGALRDSISGLSPNQVIAGAPLVRVKYANLLCNAEMPNVGLLGYMTGLSITMDTDSGFLMDSEKSESKEPVMFPRMVNFSFTFNPLHEHKLGWGTSNNWLGGNRANFPYVTQNNDNRERQALNVPGAVADGNASGVITSLFET